MNPSSAPTAARVLDPAFPTAHVRPAAGWVNDPNGPVRWRDRYHLFFQHNPADATHRDVCWGHASSDDLAHWTMEDVALVPTPGSPDSLGCWSGCVVDDEGVATAVYTGVTDHPEDPALAATICLAYAEDDDLRQWRKDPTPVAGPPEGMSLAGFRDPFVFRHEGRRYALVGAGALGGAARVLVYACDDLRAWTYLGVFLDTTDEVAAGVAPADIWECPQLARVGDEWVLIVSAWQAGRLGRVTYLLGDVALEDGTPRFVPRAGGLVDAGHDFYAPAVLNEPGRALLWGWSWEERPDVEAVASGWAGVLTLPRELEVRDGALTSRPVPEIERLRRDADRRDVDLAASGTRVELPPGPLDLEVLLQGSTCEPLAVLLEGDGLVCHIDVQPDRGLVRLRHPSRHEERRSWATETPLPRSWDGQLRVVVDGDLLEVHVSGAAPFTERLALPADGRLYVGFRGPLSGRGRVRIWPLDPITVTDTTQVLSPIA